MKIAQLEVIADQPPVLDPDDPRVRPWSDENGRTVALAASIGEWNWLEVKGVGSYRFPIRPSTAELRAQVVPLEGVGTEVLIDQYYRGVVPFVWQAYGMETLHGSAVVVAGGAVALCAERRTGKSTLAFALQRRGARPLADDAVLLDFDRRAEAGLPASTGIHVQPIPFTFRLRRQSAQHFEVPDRSQVAVRSSAADSGVDSPVPLNAVVILGRGDEGIAVAEVSSKEAFRELLRHAQVFTIEDRARKSVTVANYLRLARSVAVWRVTYPAGLEHVDDICQEIERIAGLGAAPSGLARPLPEST